MQKSLAFLARERRPFPQKTLLGLCPEGPALHASTPPGTLPQHVTHSAFRDYFFTKRHTHVQVNVRMASARGTLQWDVRSEDLGLGVECREKQPPILREPS